MVYLDSFQSNAQSPAMAAAGADDSFSLLSMDAFQLTNPTEQLLLRLIDEAGMIKFIQQSASEDLTRIHLSGVGLGDLDSDGTLAHSLIARGFTAAAKALYEKLDAMSTLNVFFLYVDPRAERSALFRAVLEENLELLQYFHDKGVPLDRIYRDDLSGGKDRSAVFEAGEAGRLAVMQLLFRLRYDRALLHSKIAFRRFKYTSIIGHADRTRGFISYLAAIGSDVFSNMSYATWYDRDKIIYSTRLEHMAFLENMVLAEKQPEDVRPFYTALLVGNNHIDALKESLKRKNFGDSPRRFFEMAVGPFLQDPVVQKTLNQPIMRPVATFLKTYGNLSWLLPDTKSISGRAKMREYASTDLVEVGRLFFGKVRKQASKWAIVVRKFPPDVWLTILTLIYRPLASNLAEWHKMIKSSLPLAFADPPAAPSGPQREFVHVIM